MSSPQGERDIVRLRTFADDFERAKSGTAQAPRTESVTPYKPETPEPTVSETPLPRLAKKRPEALKEEAAGTSLDAVGITFDQDVGKKVEFQAYEESQNIVKTKSELADQTIKIPDIEEARTLTAAPKASLLSDDDDSFRTFEEDEGLGRGSIIRDTKRERFHLVPAIIKSIQGWFEEKKENYNEAHEEKYTVQKTQERVETIKAAAQKKTQAPDEDFTEVAKRLKEIKRNPLKESTVAVKPKAEIVAPQWSHKTDETGRTPEQIPRPLIEPEISHGDTEIVTPERPMEKVVPKKESEQAPIAVEEPKPIVATSPKQSAVSQVASSKKSAVQQNTPARTLSPSPMIAVAVVSVAIILGIGSSYYLFTRNKEVTVVQNTTSVRSLIATQMNIPVQYSSDHVTFFNLILDSVKRNVSQSVHIYPVESTADGELQISVAKIAELITLNAPSSFTRAITDINFGGVSGQPFIIIKVTNFDTAFVGMLTWEQTMSADLSPLFGEPVRESFDPFARTDTQVREAFFKDVVASNLSSRLLVDGTGKERLMYAFADKNTIIITTTREAMSEITPLLP